MRWGALVLLVGCGSSDPQGPRALYEGPGFFDRPWPSDARTTAAGTPDLAGFPNPWSNALLDDYIAFVEAQPGFATQAPIYVRFDGAIDVSQFPPPADTLLADSPVRLVDLDANAPTWLTAIPVQFEWTGPSTNYQPGNLLAVAPVFGFPLRPATRYALVLTTAIATADPAFVQALAPDGDRALADLRAALPLLDLDPDDVAVATTFTTTDPTAEMRSLVRMVREDLGLPDLDLDVEVVSVLPDHSVYRTHYPTPRFTHGERPYWTEGGGFAFRADGQPVLDGWDDMRLAVCVPHEPAEGPPGGWPVVIQQHGTGGDYLSHCNSDSELEIARQLGLRGFVSLGIDQPLHGTRNGGEPASDLANFNLFNATGATSNFRQGAVDAIYLARALAAEGATFTRPDAASVTIDPSRVFFFGHSQGGLTGAIAAPYFQGDVDAAVLSGAGGTLAITIVDRKDVLDFAMLLSDTLQFADNEVVTEMHPAVGLIQTAVERTDPVNYARYWFAERPDVDGAVPMDLLLTSGTQDEATPYRTAVSLAAAGHVPVLAPGATDEVAFVLRGTAERDGPLQDDVARYDGTPGTSGVAQWKGADHYLVFDDPVAADVYGEFLEGAAQGAPVIGRPKDFR